MTETEKLIINILYRIFNMGAELFKKLKTESTKEEDEAMTD